MTEVASAPVEVGAKVFSAKHADRMRVTRVGILRKAWQLKRDGTLAESKEDRAEQIAMLFVAEQPDVFEACRAEDGRDWESFFAALVKFITAIMPIIAMFLSVLVMVLLGIGGLL